MGLQTYQQKRNFARTPEPKGEVMRRHEQRFVVQEHHASRLHYDFRLEIAGVLKSWAVPKGPSMNPGDKCLAVQVEDHPVEYIHFEGEIAEGNYGAGKVFLWDTGTFDLAEESDPLAQLEAGKLTFILHGEKQWLLIKADDRFAQPDWTLEPILTEEGAAASGRTPRRTSTRTTPTPVVRKEGRERYHAARRRTTDGQKANVPTNHLVTTSALEAKKLQGDLQLQLAKTRSQIVSLTHLDKVYWEDAGYTKGELIQYYYRVSKFILPYLKDRPLILKRWPNGIEGDSFFQHEVADAPAFVRTVPVQAGAGRTIDYAVCDNLATLLYLTNLGTIEQHPWHSRVANLDHPDWIVFDLDPEDVAFEVVCHVALATRDVLERLGLASYPKTSGSRGMHLCVPIQPEYEYETVARFAEMVAAIVAHENSDRATVVRSLAWREAGRVYVDHLQNAKGKTAAAPYSVRARPSATVSAPLEWKEIERGVLPRQFTPKTMPTRLVKKGDLFKPVLSKKQLLDKALKQVQAMLDETRMKRGGRKK